MSEPRRTARYATREFFLFLVAGSLVGFATSMVDSVFNNFLSETFAIGNLQRTALEVPRETPGFLTVFVASSFFFLCSRHLAALANLIACIGLVLIGTMARSYSLTLIWLFIYSTGQHLFMPLSSGIGMELAKGASQGRVLGDLQGAANVAAILGSFVVFTGFSRFHFTFSTSFMIAAAALAGASWCIWLMKPDARTPIRARFRFRKRYRLFYLLTILFGARKQIFLTLAPWVLVTVFHRKTQFIATLLTVGGLIGIPFKPLLGRAIDRIGERVILTVEGIVLVLVCLGYGFADALLPARAALIFISACFVIDQLSLSVGMARATYLKKIALDPSDVTPTLTLGTTVDHVFSISIALASGAIWSAVGYRYVFLAGACIAAVDIAVALKVPSRWQITAGALSRDPANGTIVD